MSLSWAQTTTLHLGIYAHRDLANLKDRYQPLAEYLQRALPNQTIELHLMNGETLHQAVLNNQLDLLLLNPALFEVIRHEHSLTGAVATLERSYQGISTPYLGGVIFSLNPRWQTLADLQKARIAIASTSNAGAYVIALRELKRAQLNLNQLTLIPTGSNDAVVEQVLSGQADVGFVRTGLLEEYFAEGRLQANQVQILNQQFLPNYPFIVSTTLYPEWPFVILNHVPAQTQRTLIAQLLQLNAEHPVSQAIGIGGFVPPLNYMPMQQLLQELQLYPYNIAPEISLAEFIHQHRIPAILLGFSLLGLLALMARILHLNRQQQMTVQTLKQQENTLQQVISGTQAGTWEWDIPMGSIKINRRWAQIVGYELEALTPLSIETWNRLVFPEDLLVSNQRLAEHFAQQSEHYECQVRMRHKNGQWVWVLDRGRVWLWNEKGEPIKMSGTHLDISEIKQHELLLAHKAQRDAVLLQLPIVIEQKSEADFVIHALQALLNLTQSDLTALYLAQKTELICLGSAHSSNETRQNSSTEMTQALAIWQHLQTDKQPKFVEKDALPTALAQLEYIGYCAVPIIEKTQTVMLLGLAKRNQSHDVSTLETAQLFANTLWRLLLRNRTQARLRQAASVFDSAQEGIIIADAQGLILDVNQAFQQITGYRAEDVIGKTPHILSSGLQNPAFYQQFWQDLTAKGHWSGELWNRRKNGELYPQRLTINTTRNHQGEVQHYIALIADITDEKNHIQQLEYLANHDQLTDLPNRILLTDRINQAILRSERSQTLLATVFIDLDLFKPINDQYGHAAGDWILKILAERFKACLRHQDTIARIGGDEFVALIIDLNHAEELRPVLERLRAAAEEPIEYENHVLTVTASIGAYLYQKPLYSEETLDADQLMREADQAMYQAKQQGKNRYVIYPLPLAI
ncbi:MAG: diguanylate cyclase [Thiotrichales bacterium]|nr:diguanylate cyclase [Thiotrichales bacterium]